ncbi:hypothetical protein E2N92_08725 [Methanofollis formosanus]|uniref:Uncharacterized protein n=1 Tax=Methanofollis formosanus TaxID=299308 RepID=A0A8G1A1T8_9EURY|nr:hypothetical protein [Methanofollis formosanus]QYZ79505.1 hypothetical protein E2N92_08725 [Methanofollis formosanus]
MAGNGTLVPDLPMVNQSLAAFDTLSEDEVLYVPPGAEDYSATAEYLVFGACAGCTGPAASAKTVKVTAYPVIVDPDLADPVHLGRAHGVKVDVFPAGDLETFQGSLGGYEADATAIAGTLFNGDLGTRTAFVAVFFRDGTPGKYTARFILNAADAARFGDQWENGSYIRLRDWSEASVPAEKALLGYEKPGLALKPTGPAQAQAKIQFPESCDDGALRQRMSETADDLAATVSDLSLTAGRGDHAKAATLAMGLTCSARSYATDFKGLEVPESSEGARTDFVRGLDAYVEAGSALWYGAKFENSTVYDEGATALAEARDTLNGVLGALNLQTLDDPTLELGSTELYPDALPLGKAYVYADAGKVHKLSVKPESYKYWKSYSVNGEEVTAPYGKTFFMLLTEVNYVAYYGGGSSKVKTPAPQAFSLLADGETYTPAKVSASYLRNIGTVYQSVNLDRDDRRAVGYLIFEVPESFDPANAHLKANFGAAGSPVWEIS